MGLHYLLARHLCRRRRHHRPDQRKNPSLPEERGHTPAQGTRSRRAHTAKLVVATAAELEIAAEDITCFTDSYTTLLGLGKDPLTWKQFVRNCVDATQ